MTASRRIAIAALITTTGATAAQSQVADYILIERLPQTSVGQHPQHHAWVLPGGGCLAVIGPGNVGGNPQRHTERLFANAWSNGPNGVKEWGMGDDVSLGVVPASWSMESAANEAHSGSFCLHDSPAGYSNNDASATWGSSFDLTGVGEATLTFWHHYEGSYSSGGNDMYVEARTGAGSWTELESYTYFGGFHAAYLFESISLGGFVGQSDVELRFRINAQSGNGWTIDDVLLLADGEVIIAEDFETGTDGWDLGGTWGLIGTITDTPYLSNDAIGEDRFGNPLAQVDATGVVTPIPVGTPTGSREGMGYSFVSASYQGHTDGVMVYDGAMEFVPE